MNLNGSKQEKLSLDMSSELLYYVSVW